MCLKIWPTTLTSKPLCLVCVPLWVAPYAILIAIRLCRFTHVDNYIYNVSLFRTIRIHYIYQSNLFILPTVLPAITFRFLSPGLKFYFFAEIGADLE